MVVCTEVEAQLRGVYLAHFTISEEDRKRLSTKNYFELNRPMKLNEYELMFTSFPWLGAFSPFRDWDKDKPTQSLVWYDHYNKTKHDREANFDLATLESVFQAVAALAVIFRAQYGDASPNSETLGNFLTFTKGPVWRIEDLYIPPVRSDGPDGFDDQQSDLPSWQEIKLI